ncbi:ABC-F family ATP-binding cassette domain-containing protein [Actinoplanes sp. GCM10030250]|uniref:ABC-F family ATP-binding cassette domain-containing protein n=1 Tax=Actinoplanes sp. GCM10030250 TaxID=3273376 RepID=UPI00360D70EF
MSLSITLPARARAQLVASQIRVVRGGRPVLDGVDLAVSSGTRWGVVGENGRGKSTLLQVLSGTLVPDAGTVQLVGTIGVAEQEMTAGAETVGDAIDAELADARAALRALDEGAAGVAAGRPGAGEAYARALTAAETLGAWDADRRVDLALESLNAETDRGRPLRTLSVGQRYRVRLACLLGAGHDFLLLDEPTNHLDAAGLDFLTARLRAHPGGIVLVSHDRALLTDVATTILDLDPSRDGRPVVHGGGYAGFQAGRAAALVRWEQEYAQQREAHARLTRDLSSAQNRLVSGWRPDKGTGRHKRATRAPGLVRSVHRRREDLERHAVTAPEPPLRFVMPHLPARPGTTLLAADGVTVEGRLRKPVSLALESGSRLIVTGPNGAGKSTLLAVLAGLREPSAGVVRSAPGVQLNLLAQESPEGDARRAEEVVPGLAALGLLPAADRSRPVRELSTGQQRRLDLARLLVSAPHVILLDEPTNHLSIALVDELTEALRVTPAAVVIATHDRQMGRDLAGWPHLSLAD